MKQNVYLNFEIGSLINDGSSNKILRALRWLQARTPTRYGRSKDAVLRY